MSYLPVGNYDIKVLQHRSRKYNLLHLCCQWEWKLYILNDQMGKSYYYMIKLLVSVTQFGQIWKRLNEITFDCGANFTDVKHLDGYDWWRLCCVSTDTADGTIQILMSKVHPMVTINCLLRYFLLLVMSLCWWWKICAARRRNPSRNRSEGPGGTILPLDTMNHHFTTIAKVHQKGSSGDCHQMSHLSLWESGQVQVFFSHVDYIQVWQWFVRAVSTDVDTGSIQSRISNRSNLNNRLTTLDALLLLIT